MPNTCCAYGCSATSDTNKDVIFHQFPDAEKDKERYLKWFHATKRKNFKPSKTTKLCSLHFLSSDYTPSVTVIGGTPRLKKDAVPSKFNFPDHLEPKKRPERRAIVYHVSQPQEISYESDDDSTLEMGSIPAIEPSHSSVGVQTVITGIEFTETISELRREKECLRMKLARRNIRVSTMSEMINLLKKESLLDDCAEGILKSNFSSALPIKLFENEVSNADKAPTNRRYSDEMKQFCLTLHFYSPKAYDFIRKRSTLPDPSTIRRWVSTRDCKPGILTEVIEYLKKENSKCDYLKEVALIYDAMAIRSGRFYNRKEDKFTGYCDLGGIIPEDSEEFATDALFFLIVSFTQKFKCPVAYFLVTKVNASTQSQLVSAIIDSLLDAGSVVRSLDYTSFTSIKNRGCLLFVSKFVMDIIVQTDKLYSKTIIPGNLRKPNLHKEILYRIRKYFIMSGRLQNLNHPITDTVTGDRHEIKIVNYVASHFLYLRLFTQSKEVTLNYIGEKKQMRHYLNHIVLFNHT